MRENTFYKTLTAVSLTAAMSMGSIVPVYGQSTMQPLIKERNNKTGIEVSGNTLTIYSGTYSSVDVKDLSGKDVVVDGTVEFTDPLHLNKTNFSIEEGAELTVPSMTIENMSMVNVNGKLALTEPKTTIDNSTITVSGKNSLLTASPAGADPIIELSNNGTISVDTGNIDLTAKKCAISGNGLVMINNDSNTYANFKGSGPVIDLQADQFMVDSGSVYIEGATSPSYEQYVNGNTHPGLTHSIVNGVGEPLCLFVVQDGQLPEEIQVEGDQGQYSYQFGYRNGSADIWVPAAFIQYEGDSGTVNGEALTNQGVKQKEMFIRGLSLKESGFTLPTAVDPNMNFAGWQTADGKLADENTILSQEINTLTAQYTMDVKLDYVCNGKSVEEKEFTLQSADPIISAADIEKDVPQGYELAGKANDVTFTKNGEVQTIEVKEIVIPPAVEDWNVSIEYKVGSDVIDAYKTTVKSDNAIISATDIEKNVPQGYELTGKAGDVTFTKNGEVQTVEVKKKQEETSQQWSVELTFKDKTSHEVVGKTNISLSPKDLTLTAEQIKAAVPEGYVLAKTPENTTLTADMFKNGRLGLIYVVEKKTDQTPVQNNNKTTSSAQTSASTHAGLWIGLTAGAAAVIGLLLFLSRRKK